MAATMPLIWIAGRFRELVAAERRHRTNGLEPGNAHDGSIPSQHFAPGACGTAALF
jgi:hypothetical protein